MKRNEENSDFFSPTSLLMNAKLITWVYAKISQQLSAFPLNKNIDGIKKAMNYSLWHITTSSYFYSIVKLIKTITVKIFHSPDAPKIHALLKQMDRLLPKLNLVKASQCNETDSLLVALQSTVSSINLKSNLHVSALPLSLTVRLFIGSS